MRSDTKLTCPHCEERFTKSDAAWTVCLTCGDIFPPGEDSAGHGPGPRYAENVDANLARVWPCNSGVYTYSREAAVAKQEEVRSNE